MTWKITNQSLDNHQLLVDESLFSLANGYLGVRGNFEEGYSDKMASIRGAYINAFHDETEITYGEKLHAFPETQQKILNIIDSQTVLLYLDGERFSLFSGEILSYERNLHMDKGYGERIIHWKSPNGKEVVLHFRRLVSFVTKELFAIDLEVKPVTPVEKIEIVSIVEGDVSNFVDKSDPRVASDHAKRLFVSEVYEHEHYHILKATTYSSKFDVACVTTTNVDQNYSYKSTVKKTSTEEVYEVSGDSSFRFTKLNIYTDTMRHGDNVVEQGIKIHKEIKKETFEDLLKKQENYLTDYWKKADIVIDGDNKIQQGIRFNLFHLLQAAGKDEFSNIPAKGLSGEGYEGHYFWDTEIYMNPVFLMTNPELARSLLLYRYSILDYARQRAKEMGHAKGALFPWRTISGTECSAFFPAGTAQYHISADIAYGFIQYYLVTGDGEFLKQYMAEVLFETARLWIEVGHMYQGEFRIDNVTGPDEYTCIVNNNYYTNAMAKHNLLWAEKAYHILKETDPVRLTELTESIHLTAEEVRQWKVAGMAMYLPFDQELRINAQDDSFLRKARWDFEKSDEGKGALLVRYHPLTLYRYQVCKQADTVLAHFLLEGEEDLETIRRSYDYYEEITTHDSSLSYCIFSIMASKLGYSEKAYQYFIETARLDLDNTHSNTKDGLHMANMGGTWLAIVFGFAGLRIAEEGITLRPSLPKQWRSLQFSLSYRGRLVRVQLEKDQVTYSLTEGDILSITHCGEKQELHPNQDLVIPN
ncbi:glycoside hydrolase family 65 protein [Evansella tamaricis]|uniref:Family 65 glycosyl hydrolase n=1 Tax=Evansella tamaricis TaxID=2069301 RepID=A0ABS6JG61_9BACI|nr:glycosyl hydrolase family 65 protein [Evansella tamaricis]MBU9712669.1 family 65 glycosyl hydrolase [Evansella tamaricis]